MDDLDSRRVRAEVRKRRRARMNKNTCVYVWKQIKTYKHNILTGVLLLLMLALLFGLASELQAPITNPPPSDETVIDYSTFVKQVEMGNVLAVTIQGNQINGLLAKSLPGQTGPTVQAMATTQQKASLDSAAWERVVNTNSPSWTDPSTPSIDPQRAVYTRVPVGSGVQLMPLLLSKHVLVTTLPLPHPASWVGAIWRFAPIVLLVVLLILFFKSNSGSRTMRTMDDRITQIGKSRARRFIRVHETNNAQQDSSQAKTERNRITGTPVKVVTPRMSTEAPVTFADVAGIDEVKTDLEEIVRFLRSPEQFKRLGARIPRGALLVGPPGTGKTLLARAVAGEAGVPFFSISASEFVEMFVGVGASRVRDLFNQARQAAPSVIFIDEIDAVGRKRSARINGNDERDQTLNQLLVELDGFDERHAVVVMAATNRADILDKALLRPGRFDRRITVSLPDRVGREAVLRVHTRKTPLHEDVSLERLARLSTGMSGADLANLVNEAALMAARRDLPSVTNECFEEALARIQLGAVRPLVMSEQERRIIAFHEGGHALVAYHLPEADTVNRVTILPRGQSLGVTQFTAEEDRYNYSRETLMARIAVGLGGRVAEELVFGPERITTGAENDLQVVTDLARRMVTRWGMSEQVGVVFADLRLGDGDFGLNMRRLDPDDIAGRSTALALDADGLPMQNGRSVLVEHHNTFAMTAPAPYGINGAAMNALIDSEVRRILDEGRMMARTILTEHRHQLDRLADALMEHEQLDRAQFESLLIDKE
jgi:ATP-dependent metalloprotease FtsH